MTIGFLPKLMIILLLVCMALHGNIIFCTHKEIDYWRKKFDTNDFHTKFVIYKKIRSIWENVAFGIVDAIGAVISFSLLMNGFSGDAVMMSVMGTFAFGIIVKDIFLSLIFSIQDLTYQKRIQKRMRESK